jgi:hypothetical protein
MINFVLVVGAVQLALVAALENPGLVAPHLSFDTKEYTISEDMFMVAIKIVAAYVISKITNS